MLRALETFGFFRGGAHDEPTLSQIEVSARASERGEKTGLIIRLVDEMTPIFVPLSRS